MSTDSLWTSWTISCSVNEMAKKERTTKNIAPIKRNCVNIDDPEFSRKPKEGHGFIYCYHFIKSGKSYIGQTIRTIRQRLMGHRHRTIMVDNLIMSGAKFTMEILSEPKIDYLDDAERFCISHFDTLYPKGYNLLSGGQDYKSWAPSVRERLSDSQRRRCENYSDEQKRKMVESARKTRENMKFKYDKKVICLETGEVYKNYRQLKALLKEEGKNVNLFQALHDQAGTIFGLHYIYWTEYIENNREETIQVLDDWMKERRWLNGRKSQRTICKKYNRTCSWREDKPILCLETGEVFRSAIEAERKTHGEYLYHNILDVVKDKGYAYKDRHFVYYTEEARTYSKELIDMIEELHTVVNRISLRNRPEKTGIFLRCLETGEIFSSKKNVGLRLNVSRKIVDSYLKGKRESLNGFHFITVTVA